MGSHDCSYEQHLKQKHRAKYQMQEPADLWTVARIDPNEAVVKKSTCMSLQSSKTVKESWTQQELNLIVGEVWPTKRVCAALKILSIVLEEGEAYFCLVWPHMLSRPLCKNRFSMPDSILCFLSAETKAAPHLGVPSSAVDTSPHHSSIVVTLEDRDLWNKFHQVGTEMIITKSGRWANSLQGLKAVDDSASLFPS